MRGVLRDDGTCPQAAQLCAQTPEPTDRMYWIYEASADDPPTWTRIGQVCLTPTQAGASTVPAVTVDDLRRLPLPAGIVHIQPGTGRTLINVPTNVYVDAPVTILSTTVLGRPVRVRATATEFTWAFGDGHTLRTTDPGAAYPDLRTTHTYTAPGQVRLTLTTTYRGEYSLQGGPWTPITGTAQVDSPPRTLTVVATRTALVDDPLPPT